MNTQQIAGIFRDIAGRVQEQTGRLMGNRRQQIRGLQRQVQGRAEKKIGDFTQAAKHFLRHL